MKTVYRTFFHRVCAAIVLSLFSAGVAADYDLGLQAYQRGDYDSAYSEWLSVAISPSDTVPPALMAETSYALGMLFWVGQGVEQNTAASARWLSRAAELGHPGAQTKLGYLYGSGQGVVQSDFEALKWTQMAANQGDMDAQYNLGVFYRDGQGVPKNTELALKWFREAAANGDLVSLDVITNYERFGWPLVDQLPTADSDPTLASASEQPELDATDPESQPMEESDLPTEEVIELDSTVEPEFPIEVVNDQSAGGGKAHEYLGEEWLQQRNPDHYTIQIIALLDSANLHAFIDDHPELQPFALYRQQWKGKPLWVLVQGDYVDIEQARVAVDGFPTEIQKRDQLWIRRFVMIQGLLP